MLITDDILGMFTRSTLRFVKRCADPAPLITADVRARFPGPGHCFDMK